MADSNQTLLQTVIEDLNNPTAVNNNSEKKPKISKVKKRRKPSEGGGHKHTHHRLVTAEVSSHILDEIQEETVDVVTERPPEIKINKILVRTPAVGIENGSNSGSETPIDNAADLEADKVKDSNIAPDKLDVPGTIIPLDREVSFSVRSDVSKTADGRPKSRKNKRPKSSMKFTKEDLELFLPRKSFFNSHDKILIEAGHQVDTHKERKKPDWRSILRMHTMEELYPPKKESEADDEKTFGLKDDDSESEDELFSLEKTETQISKEGKKSKSKSSGKKGLNPEREEYKPLYEYLKYILENPDEYVAMTKFTGKNLDYKHPNNLVRMGRVYRRGANVHNSIFLHALTGLKASNQEQPSNTQEESELIKLKVKAETWMKGLTTQQYLKAKELALKDVGDEDINHTKWWLAFRTCQYLRLPKHVVGEG